MSHEFGPLSDEDLYFLPERQIQGLVGGLTGGQVRACRWVTKTVVIEDNGHPVQRKVNVKEDCGQRGCRQSSSWQETPKNPPPYKKPGSK